MPSFVRVLAWGILGLAGIATPALQASSIVSTAATLLSGLAWCSPGVPLA